MAKAPTTIAELTLDPKNARKRGPRAEGLLIASLQEVGAARSIVIDEAGRILAGNGTVQAAAEAGIERVQVVDADGETIVAVRRIGLTEQQKRRLSLLDNRTGELAEWDPDVLAALAQDGTELGDLWANDELEALLGGANAPEAGGGGDAFDATPQDGPTCCKLGDLWSIGPHRLGCGDCTDERTVAKVLDNQTPQCAVYDPPWDTPPRVDLPQVKLVFGDGSTLGRSVEQFGAPAWVFAWDCVSSWYVPNRPLRRMKLALWYGPLDEYDADGAHYGEAGKQRRASNTRGSYWFVPDSRGKHLSDVWQQPITRLHAEGPHEHEKPIDWIRLLLANCTRGLIYDPCAGSGTSLIAAHRLGRVCYGLEIEPRYCDVILRRAEAEGIGPIEKV